MSVVIGVLLELVKSPIRISLVRVQFQCQLFCTCCYNVSCAQSLIRISYILKRPAIKSFML